MRNFLSVLKALLIGFAALLCYPVLILLPKYDAYIFVLTTGRSGSGMLADSFSGSQTVNAYHEPYPILNNSLNLSGKLLRFWVWFQFYLVKIPIIFLSRLSGKNIYLESNHLFLKSFHHYAAQVFGDKLKIIVLERQVEKVAKSIYDIGKIPGLDAGNKWYLDPQNPSNNIDFCDVFSRIEDFDKNEWSSLYRSIWYWYEMNSRISRFTKDAKISSVMVKTEELNDIPALSKKLSKQFGLDIAPSLDRNEGDKNLKSGEKKSSISIDIVESKVSLFIKALSYAQGADLKVYFSVVIPLFNKEKHIKRTVDSVLNQVHKDFELIVVNDGSTDCSLQAVDNLDDPRVRVINQKNQGVSAARNHGIREAKYNWVALLDGDDEWDSNYLKNISACIQKNQNCIAYCTKTISKSKDKVESEVALKFVPPIEGVLESYCKTYFWSSSPITSSSICLNKKVLEEKHEFNLFPLGIKRGEDLDSWVRLSIMGSIYYLNKPLVIINNVEDNVSSTFDYHETFPYSRWYSYRGAGRSETFYIKLCAIKKRLKIISKLTLHGDYRVIPQVIRDALSSQ